MKVVSAVLPVITMILIGIFCRKKKLLSETGVTEIKSLISNIMLPVTLVNALGNANYSKDTIALVLIILLVQVMSMGLGFLMRRLISEKYRDLLPALTTTTENGMLGYPLYIILCGSSALGNMATLDIAVTAFGFTVWCSYIVQADSGTKMNAAGMAKMALKNPCFWGVVIGVLCGVTGALPALIASPVGVVYEEVESMVVAPLSAVILITLGYDLSLQKDLMKETLKIAGIRFAIQMVMLAVVWVLIGRNVDAQMQIAIILFFFLPVAFSSQVYAKKEENRQMISTFSSVYSMLTIVAFALLAVWVK